MSYGVWCGLVWFGVEVGSMATVNPYEAMCVIWGVVLFGVVWCGVRFYGHSKPLLGYVSYVVWY